MKNYLFFIFISFMIISCGSKKVVTTKKAKHPTNNNTGSSTQQSNNQNEAPKTNTVTKKNLNKVEKYIYQYKNIAQYEMQKHGIPASITLAQGILESGSGEGRLAEHANNHFGIKCHNWNGKKIYHDDDKKGECFRKYKNPSDSFKDHSLFLSKRSRYASLFKLNIKNYKGWAKGLRKAGYATDPKYPSKLIRIIERYQLNQYDSPTTNQTSVSPITNTHRVEKGESLYGISKKHNTTVEKIKEINNLTNNNIQVGQQLIIQ